MPLYAWKNMSSGEVIEVRRPVSECDRPPDKTHQWERVYAFGVGRVEGGGGSPGRASVKKDG